MSQSRLDPIVEEINQQMRDTFEMLEEENRRLQHTPRWQEITEQTNELLDRLPVNEHWSRIVQERIAVEAEQVAANVINTSDIHADRISGGNTNTSSPQGWTIRTGDLNASDNGSASEIVFTNGSRITSTPGSSIEGVVMSRTEFDARGSTAFFNGERIGNLQPITIRREDGFWGEWTPAKEKKELTEPVEVHIKDLKKKLGHHLIKINFDEGNQAVLSYDNVYNRISSTSMAYNIEGDITCDQRMQIIQGIGEESAGVAGDHRFSYVLDQAYLEHVKGASRIFKYHEYTHFSMSLDYMPGRIYCEFVLPQFDQKDSDDVTKRMFELKSWNAFVLYLYSIQTHLDPLALREESLLIHKHSNGSKWGGSIENRRIYMSRGRFSELNESMMKRYYKDQGFVYEQEISIEEAIGSNHSYANSIRLNEFKVMKNLLWEISAIEDRAGYAVHMLAISSSFLSKPHMRNGKRQHVRFILSGQDTVLGDFGLLFSEHLKESTSINHIVNDTATQPVRAIALTNTRHERRYPLGNEGMSEWVATQKIHAASNEHHTMGKVANPALLF